MPHYNIATRAAVVTLKSPHCGKTNAEIEATTGVKSRSIKRIYARALEAGFDPNARPLQLRDEWLADKPRSGRPSTKLAKLGVVWVSFASVQLTHSVRLASARTTISLLSWATPTEMLTTQMYGRRCVRRLT
ncbi:hypothetical protein PG993_008400 [Apiospora rasikravindrae]|uniref:Uncharacterized protein n=1 Tax=Apiospora rasikravindrae TaxID=990691 RepID=A0ABR1T095_9PEZI